MTVPGPWDGGVEGLARAACLLTRIAWPWAPSSSALPWAVSSSAADWKTTVTSLAAADDDRDLDVARADRLAGADAALRRPADELGGGDHEGLVQAVGGQGDGLDVARR